MANSSGIVPRGFWSFPSVDLPDMWEDDMDLFSRLTQSQNLNNNLSLSEDDKDFYIEAATPGVNPEDIDITLQNGMLWIRGESAHEEGKPNKKYYRKASNSFSYRVALPKSIDPNAEIDASCDNGMVKIAIPKSQQAQQKKISVKSKSAQTKQGNGYTGQPSVKSRQSSQQMEHQVH